MRENRLGKKREGGESVPRRNNGGEKGHGSRGHRWRLGWDGGGGRRNPVIVRIRLRDQKSDKRR